MTLRVGTRGSRLALSQARQVAARLGEVRPDVAVELVEIVTHGDRMRDVVLGPGLGQSFFTKEIENALLERRVDLAVHSCKDLATVGPPGLELGALLPREDPRDVLVSRSGGLYDLPAGAVVATGSVRRASFLRLVRPDLRYEPIRGNVPTRVAAVTEGRVDAVVLAAAGLHRLGLHDVVTEYLDPADLPPAAAQGAIAVQIRSDEPDVGAAVGRIDDPATHAAVSAERACLRRLEAGCQAPVGALGTLADGRVALAVAVVTPDGRLDAEAEGRADDAASVGETAAGRLLAKLGLPSLRGAAWAGPDPLRLGGQG